ncbi:hypothetical protein HZC31_01960 [Candidatus Woesearchaeota archaeon]|nr:hypothetical protein [Candidatus Woesearchaeota archaeon]
MGYLNDVIDIIALKEETYKKLGNDEKAFQRYSIAYLLSSYIMVFLLYGMIGVIIALLIPEARTALATYWYIVVAFFLLFPLIGYGVNLVTLAIKYGIGLCFGGKAKSFKDFAAVTDYITPLVMPFLFIPFLSSIIALLYCVWKYVILFKSYKIIHKLDARKAGWAVAVNVGLLMVVMLIFVALYFAFIVSIVAADIAEQESIREEPIIITDSLGAGYGVYYAFDEQNEEREILVETQSSENIDVYVVKSRADFNNFLNDGKFDFYEGCFMEGVRESYFSCSNVTAGGVLLYNPTEYVLEYNVSTS